MEQQSKSKRMTRIEVLVVILVCLFLLGIFPLTSRKSRLLESRMTCGINLSSIGKAMQVYAKDYDDKYPRAGGESSVWGSRISDWRADDRYNAYGLNPADGSGGAASITSSFYLLVKYTEKSPKTFICPGDKRVTEFKPVKYKAGDKELAGLWDFGSNPRRHCSFSYHMPYGLFTLTTSGEPGMAVAADPNPWISSPSVKGKDPSLMGLYQPTRSKEKYKIGNAITHREEGQNVLFMGGHTGFEEVPFCGIDEDNIYTYWDGTDIRRGGLPIPKGSAPMDRLDSFLVNDGRVAIGAKPTLEERNR